MKNKIQKVDKFNLLPEMMEKFEKNDLLLVKGGTGDRPPVNFICPVHNDVVGCNCPQK